MPIKRYGTGTDPEVHRRDGGITWIAHPDETMRRAGHALAPDGEVWVVEPVDAAGLDGLLADLGDVAGVVVLARYHRRHAADVAGRHGVPVYLPAALSGLADAIDAPVERFEGALAGTFEVLPLGGPLWSEAALLGEGTLVATETLATAAHLTAPGERLGVTPYRRLFPPREPLAGLDVGRVLVGHGEPVLEDAAAALEAALAGARRRAPACVLRHGPTLVRAAYVAMRD